MTEMIWTPERIAQARQRNFGESVTLTAQDWDAMMDMAERYRKALEAIATYYQREYREGDKAYQAVIIARKALDGGGGE